MSLVRFRQPGSQTRQPKFEIEKNNKKTAQKPLRLTETFEKKQINQNIGPFLRLKSMVLGQKTDV
jgi:hypothetical protein